MDNFCNTLSMVCVCRCRRFCFLAIGAVWEAKSAIFDVILVQKWGPGAHFEALGGLGGAFGFQKSVSPMMLVAFGLILEGLGAHLGALGGSLGFILGALGLIFGASGLIFFDLGSKTTIFTKYQRNQCEIDDFGGPRGQFWTLGGHF